MQALRAGAHGSAQEYGVVLRWVHAAGHKLGEKLKGLAAQLRRLLPQGYGVQVHRAEKAAVILLSATQCLIAPVLPSVIFRSAGCR